MRRTPASLLIALLALLAALPAVVARPAPEGALLAAWERAREAGSYRFTADIAQNIAPAATPDAVGQGARRQDLRLDGRADLAARALDLRIWAGEGEVSSGAGSVELRVRDNRAEVRQAGGPWEPFAGDVAGFAPDADMLGHLAAARDVVAHAPEERAGAMVARSSFHLHGPTFAEAMRERAQAQLARAGKLPPGATLSPSERYKALTGTGELWVGEDGLPLRQILSFRLPGDDGSFVSVRSSTILSDFGPVGAALPHSLGSRARAAVAGLRAAAPSALAVALAALAAAALVALRRSRRARALLALGMIGALLAGPQLQAASLRAFLDAQAAEAAAQAPAPPAPDPSAGVARQATRAADLGILRAGPAVAAPAPGAAPLAANGGDSDGDGLTNAQELYLDTSPLRADTDSDGLSDHEEVAGFAYAGQQWYSDAGNPDTNNDGLLDGMEVDRVDGAATPRDRDGDGALDVLDRDNDNDGVPDPLDLSPGAASQAFEGAGMALSLDGLTPGNLVTVEFQVRPQDSRFLWYAFTPLDWPTDRAGQVMDFDGTPDDLQVVPMLEIIMPADANNLPPYTVNPASGALDSPLLRSEQIAARLAGGGEIAAYVPLALVSDGETGSRAAFTGRMLYRAGATWGRAQRINLVWMVQVRHDPCASPSAYQGDVCTVKGTPRQGEEVIAAHVYQREPWRLTGLHIREEHGAEAAQIVVNPAAEADAGRRDDALYQLVGGLSATFGRGRADLGVAEVARRFDAATNAGVSAEQRWGLPNVFAARSHSYATPVEMVRDLTDRRTHQLLIDIVPANVEPTILTVSSDRFRALSLDSAANVEWTGGQLAVRMPTSGAAAVPEQTLHVLRWNTYVYDNGWAVKPLKAILDGLEARYLDQVAGDADVRRGTTELMRIHYTALTRGVVSGVAVGDQRPLAAAALGDTAARAAAAAAPSAPEQTVAAMGVLEKAPTLLKLLGTVVNTILGKINGSLTAPPSPSVFGAILKLLNSPTNLQFIALGLVMIRAVAIMATIAIAGAAIGLTAVGLALGFSPALRGFITDQMPLIVTVVSSTIGIVSALKDLLTISSSVINIAKATVVLAVIAGLVTLAFNTAAAVIQLALGNLDKGSYAFSYAVATAAIQITIAVVLTVIAFIPVIGPVIVALYGLIDALSTLIFYFTGLQGKSIATLTIAAVIRLFSYYSPVVKLKPEIDTAGSGMDLANRDAGYSVGNTLVYRTAVRTTGNASAVNAIDNEVQAAVRSKGLHLMRDALRWSSVNYNLALTPLSLPVDRDTMAWRWDSAGISDWKIYPSDARPDGVQSAVTDYMVLAMPLATAGRNQANPIYLNMATYSSAVECGRFFVVISCGHKGGETFRSSTLLTNLIVDVFPERLAQFFAVSELTVPFPPPIGPLPTGIKGISWLGLVDTFQSPSDVFFVQLAVASLRATGSDRLTDYDFDGLGNGADPSPMAIDGDGDGLPDAFELARRGEGRLFNPGLADSDGDGVGDAEEALAGSNPGLPDSDGDGLGDRAEIDGALVTIAGLTTRVRTSALSADSDGDGLSDAAELQQLRTPLPAGLVSYWPMGGGAQADLVSNLTAACVGACPTSAQGRVGEAASFSGDELSAGADQRFQMRDQLGFAAWIYPEPAAEAQGGILVNREGEYELALFGDGTLRWAIADGSGWWGGDWQNTGVAVPMRQWSHVAWTFDRGTVTTYVNGVARHTASAAPVLGDVVPTQNELRIGGRQLVRQVFTGSMDEVYLFSRPLTAGELQTLSGGGRLTAAQAAPLAAAPEVVSGAGAPSPSAGALYPELSDADGIVRPGQTLAYTVTVRNALGDGRPVAGELELRLPALFGGATQRQPVSLEPGQQQSFRVSLAVPAGAAAQRAPIVAVAKVRARAASVTRWGLPALQPSALAAPGRAALVATPQRAAPFLAALARDGQITLHPVAADGLGDATATVAGDAPALACTDAGACALVWAAGGSVRAALVGGAGTLGAPVTLGPGGAPALAAGPGGFLAAWEDAGSVRAAPLSAAGQAGAAVTLGDGAAPAAAAIPAGFAVVYAHGEAGSRDLALALGDGAGAWRASAFAATGADEHGPVLARDPVSGLVLAAYQRGAGIAGRVIGARGPGETLTLMSAASGAAVAGEPAYGGWVVAARPAGAPGAVVAQAVDYTGWLRGVQERWTLPAGERLALACRPGDAGSCALVPAGAAAGGAAVAALAVREVDADAELIDSFAAPATLSVTVDGAAPTAAITSPASGAQPPVAALNGALVVGGTAGDSSPIELVEVSLDGGAWQPAQGTSSWAYTLALDGLAPGSHSLRARARDVAGNQGEPSAPVSFVVDTTAPTVAAALPAQVVRPTAAANGRWSVALGGAAADAGLSSVSVVLAGERGAAGELQAAALGDGGWSLDYLLPPTPGAAPTDTYTVTLRAVDAAGNSTTSVQPAPLRVDGAAPVIALDPASAALTSVSDTGVSFSGVVTDTGAAGVASLEAALVPVGQQPAAGDWRAVGLAGAGAARSAWSLPVPAGLDGDYSLFLAAADTLGNATPKGAGAALAWSGTVDTRAPAVSVTVAQQGAGATARTTVTCSFADASLDESSLDCPAPAGALLGRAEGPVLDEAGRAAGYTSSYTVAGAAAYASSASACDRFARCASAAPGAPTMAAEPLDLIFTAPAETFVTALDPLTLAGAARSPDGLRSLSVAVDGAEVASQTWAAGAATEHTWAQPFTPAAEGTYTLTVSALDWAGRSRTVTRTLDVDLAAPTGVAFAAAGAGAGDGLALPVVVSDTGVVARVQISPDGVAWYDARRDGARWLAPAVAGGALDGESHSFDLRAVDVAGRSVTASAQSITIDFVAPRLPAPAISAGGAPLRPGDGVRDAAPSLLLSWGAAEDGSAVTYRAGWTTDAEPDPAALVVYGAGAGGHADTPAEGAAVYAHVLAADAYGNTTSASVGPIFVDAPETPAAISRAGATPLAERASPWAAEPCSVVGSSFAQAERSPGDPARGQEQRLLATWDDRALQLGWEGALWGSEGDLYVVLDTTGGGATTLFSAGMPAGQPAIATPDGFGADLLLRVDEPGAVTLYAWDGAAWEAQPAAQGGQPAYEVWADLADPTRLNAYLPFATLGIAGGAPLKLLAYATEEDALRLWATIPAANPLNSARAVAIPAGVNADQGFTLRQYLEWPALAAGVCPADAALGATGEAAVAVSLTAAPIGTVYSVLGDGSFFAADELLDGNDAEVDSEGLVYLDNDQPPLREGELITYTLTFVNGGDAAAADVTADIITWGALRLPGGAEETTPEGVPFYQQIITVPSLAAGASQTVQFSGVVDQAIAIAAGENDAWATLDVVVYDSTTTLDEPLDWIFADHAVDRTPPEDLAILAPVRFTRPGTLLLAGELFDESDVPTVDVEVRGAATAAATCADPTPEDGEWGCAVTVGDLPEGAGLEVRARATDRAGLTSDWTAWQPLTVDRTAPSLALDVASTAAVAGALLGPDDALLAGTIADNRAVAAVEVCVVAGPGAARCDEAEVVDVGATAGAWSYELSLPPGSDGSAAEVTLTALDEAGNRSAGSVLRFALDSTPPSLGGGGAMVAQAGGATTIAGTVSDGSGVAEIFVHVERPDGTRYTELATRSGASWSYTLRSPVAGEHRLVLELRDIAGNSSFPGSFRAVSPGATTLYLPLVRR